jgi:antitoxin ParD1/3/4
MVGVCLFQEDLAMTTITISLPDSLKAFVETQLATRGYGNMSEYFRGLLREAQEKEREARLEALLLEGLASKSIPLDAEFRQGLKAKVEKILDKYKDRAGS